MLDQLRYRIIFFISSKTIIYKELPLYLNKKMRTSLKKIIAMKIYYSIIPCGRKPCHCFFMKNITLKDKYYLECYQSWKQHSEKDKN